MNNQKRTNKVTRSHADGVCFVENNTFRAKGNARHDWSRKGNKRFRDYNDTPTWARGL